MCAEHPCKTGTSIGRYIQHGTVNLALPASMIALLVTMSAIIVVSMPLSDESEAYSELPVLDVRTIDGKSLSGVGAILDDATLDFVVKTSPGIPETFAVAKDTVLVSGSNYLILTGSETVHFSLSGHMFGSNPYVKDYGLRLSLHTDTSCSETPVASAEFFDTTVFIMGDDLVAGTPYYIKIVTVNDVEFDKAPNSANLGFGFDASTSSDYNAVHFHSDDQIVGSNLFRNGERFVFPQISKEGSVFIGWMSEPNGGTVYQSTDTIDVDHDIDLYAFWWTGGSENLHYTTLDGSDIDIAVEVSDKVLITVHAASSDDRVTVDIESADVAQLQIPIPLEIHLSGADDSLKESDAGTCISMTDLISAWFASHGLEPQLHIVPESSDRIDVEISALRVLKDDDFSIDIRSSGAEMILGPEALDSVYRQAVPVATGTDASLIDFDSEIPGLEGKDITLVLRPATDSDTNAEQKKTIGSNDAWYAAILVGDVEITELNNGKVTLNFPYGTKNDSSEVSVCRITSDGSRESYSTGYGGSIATIQSSRLSVFVIEEHRGDTQSFEVTIALSTALAIVAIAYIAMRIHRH